MRKNNLEKIEQGAEDEFKLAYKEKFSEAQTLMEELQRTEKLPLSKVDIKFSDNCWDFTSYTQLNIRKGDMKFNFEDVPNEFIIELKLFILISVIRNKIKIQSINNKYYTVKSFLKFLDKNNIFETKHISCYLLKLYFKEYENLEITTTLPKKSKIYDYLMFYSINFHYCFSTDILQYLKPKTDLKAHIEAHKYPAIPKTYFQKLLNLFINVMNNEKLAEDERAFACLMLIESQTGIRASDLTMIEINKIFKQKLINGVGYYMEFWARKSAKGNNTRKLVRIFINEISYTAYKTLNELHKENRKGKMVNYLFVPSRIKTLPVARDNLIEYMRRFSLNHYEELDCINKEEELKDLSKINIQKFLKTKKTTFRNYPKLKSIDDIYYPVIHQFRVNVCTELYYKGVPLEYIEKFMGHLTDSMQDYYVRPKNKFQENEGFAKNILREVVSGEVELLGKNTQALISKIDEFIVAGKFNVAKDTEKIVNQLAEKIPIRAKCGGLCIKGGKRECALDAETDEFYCAYGVCPNSFHLFYMADVSYERYLAVKETYTYNKENGFLRQSEKEKFKLINTVKDMLIPELDEVKKEVDKKGKKAVKDKYPQLNDIIENFDSIYKEAEEWMK